MEKRRIKRIAFNLDAMLVSRSLNYSGVIRDCTDTGIAVHIHPGQKVNHSLRGMIFEVTFVRRSGANINLQCKVVRTQSRSVAVQENLVSMKIIDQPPEYREFLKTLR